jgi:AAA ATPase domain
MRIKRARITDFRSIEDSGWVEINDVSCLVGKNESGKTNFLLALARMNPAPGQGDAFDLTDDFPRRRLSDIEAALKNEGAKQPIAITVEYALTGDEVAALRREFGPDTTTLGDDDVALTVTKDYAGKGMWSFNTNEEAAVRYLVKQHGIQGPAATSTSLAQIVSAAGEAEPGPAVTAAAGVIQNWPDGDLRRAILAWLKAREPMYIYFSDYERMAGEGNVRELIEMRNRRDELEGPDRTFLALLDMAKADLNDLNEGAYNALKARLEAASIKISEQLYSFWRQNENSEIEIDHDYVEVVDQPTLRDLVLKVRVRDKRHALSVPVDQRSNGFVWFFSFLVNFSQIRDLYPQRPLVLLLDEPGTALHGLAQRDFLDVIDERLKEHQVIYTTHQPFLVDPDHLDRARPVEDKEPNGDDDGAVWGTRVSNNPYKISNDTLFPLQAALGYAIGQTLFVAPNVLLVEGTSDLIYLQMLSRAAESSKKVGLDRRWTITPVGGVDKMDTFVRLFKANQLNTCALIDVSGNKKAKVEKLVASGDLKPEQVVRVSDFASGDEADIEDLFDVAFYIELVQGAGAEGGNPMTALVREDALSTDDARITRRIDALLKGLGQPRLDHVPPARFFEAHQEELLGKLDKAVVDRFVELFVRVNDQLTK